MPSASQTIPTIDALDRRLIRVLQDHPRAQYRQIAQMADISESTAKRRVLQLIERGVIEPAMMSDIASLGYPARAYIQLRIEPQQVRAAAEQLCTYDEIASVGLITGRFDIICLVVLPTLRDLPDFMAERIAPLRGLLDTETIACTDMVKAFADWRLPVE